MEGRKRHGLPPVVGCRSVGERQPATGGGGRLGLASEAFRRTAPHAYGRWRGPRAWLRRRGYGIHSPFVYGLVRAVFAPRGLTVEERVLKLHEYCTGGDFEVSGPKAGAPDGRLTIMAREMTVVFPAGRLPHETFRI